MTLAEIPSLFPDEVESRTPPSRGEHGYYKRGDNGWIVTAGVWPTFRNDMEYKGWRFLSEYGTFTMDAHGSNSTKDVNGRSFGVADEPWRLILQRGGAREFPIEQIIAFHWHIRPPYREANFPQLEGVRVYDFNCPECEKGLFSSTNEQDAIDQLRQHLTSRTNDAHSYRPDDLKALGEEYGIDFFAPRRGMRRVVRASKDEEVNASAPEMTPNETFVCPDCGRESPTLFGLNSHRHSHKVSEETLA